MSDLENKAVEILDKLDALTTQYAPDVIEKATTAVTVTGVHNLVNSLVGFIALYGVWFATKKLTSFFVKKKQDDGYYSEWEIGYTLSYAIGGVVCVCIAMANIWTVFDVWNWTAIFNPELAMAHRVLGL